MYSVIRAVDIYGYVRYNIGKGSEVCDKSGHI